MRLLILPCDGIGPEIIEASIPALSAVDRRFQLNLSWDYDDVGFLSLKKHGTTLRNEVLERARAADGIILGTQSHMDYPAPEKGGRNISAAVRVELDLYANVRPARTRPSVPSNMPPGRTMDLVIVREATEGFYSDRNMFMGRGEFMPVPGVALSLRKITAPACERIARRAFELARRRRRKVTAVHKANNFLMTDGLFMEQVRRVATEYPDVALNDHIVDAMAAHLVRDPSRFDVIVTTNFYADILSDLASELAGGLGLAGSIMHSDTLCCAQAQHGSAPDIERQGIANPTSMLLSIAMLLSWLGARRQHAGLEAAGTALERAVDQVLERPELRTRDLGGPCGTAAFGAAVAAAVEEAT